MSKATSEERTNTPEITQKEEMESVTKNLIIGDGIEEHSEAATDSAEDVNQQINMKEKKKRKAEKEELIKAIEKCEKLGGEEFDVEQERVLRELTKQKETIKKLLDEMQKAKKERKTHNIQTIFQQKTE